MVKRKLFLLNATIILGLSSAITIPTVFAESTSQQIQQADENIKRVDKELSQVEQQILRVEEAMRENSKMIAKTEEDIKNTEAQVKKLEKDIKELNQSIEKRKELLAKRAVALQESGGTVDYLEVLLGAESFGDFVNRAYTVSQIASADKELIEKFESDKKALEEKKKTITEKLDELNDMKAELDAMKACIAEQHEKTKQMKADLTKEKQANINKRNELKVAQEQARQKAAQPAGKDANNKTNNQNTQKPKPAQNSNNGNKAANQPAKPAPASNQEAIEIVITAGYKYIGNSAYKFGGGRTQWDIERGLFDCSGFVHWAFKQAGYNIGSTTDQLKNQGTRVSVNNMKRGDLVFFDTYKKDGHVGIYLGNGKFIGSQNSTGVAIADMSSGYWASKFNGRVNRIIK